VASIVFSLVLTSALWACAAEPQPSLGRQGSLTGNVGGGGGGDQPPSGGSEDPPSGGSEQPPSGGGSEEPGYTNTALGFYVYPADGWALTEHIDNGYITLTAPEVRGLFFIELISDADTAWCRDNVDAVMDYVASSLNFTSYALVATDERSDLGSTHWFEISFMMTDDDDINAPTQIYITDDGYGGCFINQFVNGNTASSDFDDVDAMLTSFRVL
jgi:hypothetical protein